MCPGILGRVTGNNEDWYRRVTGSNKSGMTGRVKGSKNIGIIEG